VWRWEGEAFGDTRVAEGFSVEVRLRFPGQYFDEETGLHQNWWRTYDPQTGRYVRSDSIGLNGGSNTYNYTFNNPLRYMDPTGEIVPIVIGAIVLKVAGGAVIGAGTETLIQAGSQLATDGQIRADCFDVADIAIAGGFGAAGVPGIQNLRKLPRLAKRINRNPSGNRKTSELFGDVAVGGLGGEAALLGAQAITPPKRIGDL